MTGAPVEDFFATCPKGIEELLAAELEGLGAREVRSIRAGARFSGDLATAYRACLWSRLASRVLMPLGQLAAADSDQLYSGVHELPWEDHLSPRGTLAVDFTVSGAPTISHTQYGAQRVKDGVVDRLRARFGERPSVDLRHPDLRIYCHLQHDQATIGVDLSGDSLHRRGYRLEGGEAPLKENLAAAILIRAGWPEVAGQGGILLDPLCGSGTLLIEGALMAADVAPGLGRRHFGFLGWLGHSEAEWSRLREEAEQRREIGLARTIRVIGADASVQAVARTRENLRRAGVEALVQVRCAELSSCSRPGGDDGVEGLLVANPPYGERLGEERELAELYRQLGDCLKRSFGGWRAAVFTGNPELGKRMGLRAHKRYRLYNGALPCRLLLFQVHDQESRAGAGRAAPSSPGQQMLENRLRKNRKRLARWLSRDAISCYRLYDADMPEYNLAVDVYGDWVHLQEYAPPASVDLRAAARRFDEARAAVLNVLELPAERVAIKVRQRQRGDAQYQRVAHKESLIRAAEGEARFLVNLTDFLDTGLFLDHRITRRRIQAAAAGKRFLNLFAYTGTASVCAALGGAASTTSVDLSQTYLGWAGRNLALNGFVEGEQHRLVRADCVEWLEREQARYDLIFLDVPTFSNSKRMRETFEVQRDHLALLRSAARRLAGGGLLMFSCNFKRFKIDREALAPLQVHDITGETIPKDFERSPRVHHLFEIRQAESADE